MMKAYHITIKGIVQGVGFRPFIHDLAGSFSLCGYVLNRGSDVLIYAETEDIEPFIEAVRHKSPANSDIREIIVKETVSRNITGFVIRDSLPALSPAVHITPDIAICETCRKELSDRGDRRVRYPFTTCTDCGPRFSILGKVPFDRNNTAMAKYKMCERCQKEYDSPRDRRHHSQTNSCFRCGPRITAYTREGICGEGERALAAAADFLKKGKIVAVKGTGGYHIACDGRNSGAVLRLRQKKNRETKPLAVMFKDIDTLTRYCETDGRSLKLLVSPAAPVVLLKKKNSLAKGIADGHLKWGAMLPYTPLHQVLFDMTELDGMVMTSANISNEPIISEDESEKLLSVSDLVLSHDRKIENPCDDSVTAVFREETYFFRRARGYVPLALDAGTHKGNVLALGGETNSTFCLYHDGANYLSQYLGDLKHYECMQNYERYIDSFCKMTGFQPDIIAFDLHPEYNSSKHAKKFQVKKIAVQHHHAHMVSCMAENNIEGKAVGVIWDGTGYGSDGTVWGGEFFVGDYKGVERKGHIRQVPLYGGEAAAKEPWRMALSWLKESVGEERALFRIRNSAAKTVLQTHPVKTSSGGRLFDAVASILGICDVNTFDAEAPVMLEQAAAGYMEEAVCLDYRISGDGGCRVLDVAPTIRQILEYLEQDVAVGLISADFHLTMACAIAQICDIIDHDLPVVLSGGVFQNLILLDATVTELEKKNRNVFWHKKLPSNDAGISLGQCIAAIGRAE